jgi:hypothetical protein
MFFLTTAVVLVGLLCALDLVLTLGVIRRLREHTDLLAELRGGPGVIAVGEPVDEFVTSTVDGEEFGSAALTGETLVAFFSPDCRPCKEKMPWFIEYARTRPGGRDQVMAVVVGDADEAAPAAADLSPVARVVVEAAGGPLNTAFKVRAYPSVLVVERTGGRLLVRSNQVDLEQPATAPA